MLELLAAAQHVEHCWVCSHMCAPRRGHTADTPSALQGDCPAAAQQQESLALGHCSGPREPSPLQSRRAEIHSRASTPSPAQPYTVRATNPCPHCSPAPARPHVPRSAGPAVRQLSAHSSVMQACMHSSTSAQGPQSAGSASHMYRTNCSRVTTPKLAASISLSDISPCPRKHRSSEYPGSSCAPGKAPAVSQQLWWRRHDDMMSRARRSLRFRHNPAATHE